MNRPTVINLNPDEYNQRLFYYPFMVNFVRCKTEDINLSVFNMITRINESKTLKKTHR